MKKLLFLIPFVLFSCKKDIVVSENTIKSEDSSDATKNPSDSTVLTLSDENRDSMINNAPATKEVLRRGIMREKQGDEIIRIADAEMLPFNIGEEFTEDNQSFILKIQNFSGKQISADVKPQFEDQNIRINGIKLPNGKTDGPFGKELEDYTVPQNGEVWLIIGKSNMASGNSKGNFSVSVE